MINAIYFYRIARFFYLKNIPVIPTFIKGIIFLIYNSSIPFQCKIGSGSSFAYGGIGVVIHKRVEVGNNVIIGTNITIGGRSGHYEVPKIGDNVYLATGSKILGPIKIGENAIIGANAVVIKDVPPDTVVGGVPAEIIKQL